MDFHKNEKAMPHLGSVCPGGIRPSTLSPTKYEREREREEREKWREKRGGFEECFISRYFNNRLKTLL